MYIVVHGMLAHGRADSNTTENHNPVVACWLVPVLALEVLAGPADSD